MNAENYIKAFQGVMGFYGLSFLIAPAKMVRSFKTPSFWNRDHKIPIREFALFHAVTDNSSSSLYARAARGSLQLSGVRGSVVVVFFFSPKMMVEEERLF